MQDQLIPTLLRACYCVLEKKIILPSWKDSIMSIIQKKGRDTLNCSNYHPVSVLNVDYKLFTAILSRRRKDQTDFIRQRETQDNIRKTQHIMKHVAQYKTKTLVWSLDAEKAFESVRWSFHTRYFQNFVFYPMINQGNSCTLWLNYQPKLGSMGI